MRRVSIVVPYLATHPDHESALRPLPAVLQEVVEGASVCRLRPLPESATPEVAFLALDPSEVHVAQGPLTVAALGHRPPAGSVHFHLTLCSVDEDGVLRRADMEGRPPERPDAQERVPPFGTDPGATDARASVQEIDRVFEAVERLRTVTLTPLRGEGTDHALVWEDGSLDNRAVTPQEAYGRPYLDSVAQGEGEKLLRQFVDDSVNLLSEQEFNHVRREEGLAPLNCLWPWGQGFRPDLPNLPLRRGDVAHAESGSMRMQGLCRLVGYTHGDRHAFGTMLQTDFDTVRKAIGSHSLTMVLLLSVEEMQRHRRSDEIAYTLERLINEVIGPLIEKQREEPFELRIAAPGGFASVAGSPEIASMIGLGLTYKSGATHRSSFPFDERVLDDPRVPLLNTWEHLLGGFLAPHLL